MLFINIYTYIIIILVDKMEFIALLLIFYFFIGACVCLLICVNPNDQGVLGRLNRFVFRKVPQVFRYICYDLVTQFAAFLAREFLTVWEE
jgi:hypothetical protein